MDKGQLNVLAQDFHEKKMKLDAISEAQKEAKAEKEFSEQKLVEAMVQLNMPKMSIESVGAFSLRKSTNWNIIDQKAIVAYLKENAPEMIKMHPQSIKGWANEFRAAKENAPLMDDNDWIDLFGMKPFDKTNITLRKA